jgi:hypothetical protein
LRFYKEGSAAEAISYVVPTTKSIASEDYITLHLNLLIILIYITGIRFQLAEMIGKHRLHAGMGYLGVQLGRVHSHKCPQVEPA